MAIRAEEFRGGDGLRPNTKLLLGTLVSQLVKAFEQAVREGEWGCAAASGGAASPRRTASGRPPPTPPLPFTRRPAPLACTAPPGEAASVRGGECPPRSTCSLSRRFRGRAGRGEAPPWPR